MAFDFPATPALDQIYTSGGISYRWDGSAWRSGDTTPITPVYVLKAGDTMGGDLLQPSPPPVAQSVTEIYTSGGISYRWDGTVWLTGDAALVPTQYVLKAGDTMTGTLSLVDPDPSVPQYTWVGSDDGGLFIGQTAMSSLLQMVGLDVPASGHCALYYNISR